MTPIPLGRHEVTREVFPVLAEDRRKHMALFGKSGVGKTTLMRNMALWDIREGLSVIVIDPHGGLVDDLLAAIPKSRTNDVIYLNPRRAERSLSINLLERVPPDQRPLIVSSLVATLRNIWPDAWGPRTEWILENVAFALLDQPQPVSLLALSRVLTDPSYRSRVVEHVRDPAVLAFFTVFDGWNDRFREEAIAPLLNKVGKLVTNPLLRAAVGQTSSSFDFRWLLDTQKILLADLSKGALGPDVSSLLGSILVTKLSLAALSRQDVPEAERQSAVLYADEVHNFIHGVDFPTILSEARKYRLALVVATQTLEQLPPASRSAVFGNCATVVSFRVSGEDAGALREEFAMAGPASILQDLPDYKAYVRALMQGRPIGPHPLRMYPPFAKTGDEARPEDVVRVSLDRFGRPREDVEAGIRRFLAA